MEKIGSAEVIEELQDIFSVHGIPLRMISDNGPQFRSFEFEKYCKQLNIQLVHSTPYFPRMNGEVERQNRSLKKNLMISFNTGKKWKEELRKFLLMHRSTPHSVTNVTPAELLFGRIIRDKLPRISEPAVQEGEFRDRDRIQKAKGKMYQDQRGHAKESQVSVGDEVLLKRACRLSKWESNFEPGVFKVLSRTGGEVTVEGGGRTFTRNVSHVKKLMGNETSMESGSPPLVPDDGADPEWELLPSTAEPPTGGVVESDAGVEIFERETDTGKIDVDGPMDRSRTTEELSPLFNPMSSSTPAPPTRPSRSKKKPRWQDDYTSGSQLFEDV